MVVSDEEYNTDDVPTDSTVPEQSDQFYYIKRILSEAWDPDEEVTKYLIEWEDYPLEDCTWEPEENLVETGLLESWAEKKRRMGSGFAEYVKKNEERFYKAREPLDRLQRIRRRKRAKKRRKLRRKLIQSDEDSTSEDDIPVTQQRPPRNAKSKSSEAVPTHSQEIYNDLFVDSQDPNPIGPPPSLDQLKRDATARRPPTAHTPFVEGSTDDGDTTSTDESSDSLLVELTEKAKHGTRKTSPKLRQQMVPDLGHSILSSNSPQQKIAKLPNKPAVSASTATNQPIAKATVQAQQKPVMLTRTLTAPVVSKTPVVKQKDRRPSESAAQGSTAATSKDSNTSVSKRSTATVGATSVPKPENATVSSSAHKAAVSTAPPSSRRTGTASKIGRPIKFTNAKKVPSRGPWNTQGILYNKLKYRAKAEQRSRAEGTPDPNVLEFVGPNPPNLIIPRSSRPADNPYSRRETGYRRVEEPDEAEPTEGGRQDYCPLEDWEKDKIPLVCPEWRLSRNCERPAKLCKYLHRDKDGDGHDIEVASITGYVPPKYSKPPVTCPFWLRGLKGCFKTDAECLFAHRNTGWLPNSIHNAPPMPVDNKEKPVSEQKQGFARHHAGKIPSTNRNTVQIPVGRKERPIYEQRPGVVHDEDKTCWFWAFSTCKKSEEQCNFRHHHTGVIARNPTLCQYILHGQCKRTAETCQFTHPCDLFLQGRCSHTAETCPYPHIDSRDLHALADPAYGPERRFSTANTSHIKHDDPIDTHMHDADGHPPPTSLRPTLDDKNQTSSVPSPISAVNDRLRTLQLPKAPPRVVYNSLEMKQKIEKALKANFSNMFQWSQDEKNKLMLDRKAFLLYHPVDHQEEFELTTRWLLLHHVEVRNACSQGAWESYAREHVENRASSSVLIVHPDFEQFSALLNFGKVLQNQVRVWSLGMQEGIAYDPTSLLPPPKKDQECIEIFPAGGFIYITDDVFEARPRQALEIIKLFIAKIEKLRDDEHAGSPWQEVDNINLHWRICVRPELMEYLFAKCEEQAKALKAGEPDAMARAKLYTILSDTNYIEQDSPVLPLSPKPDKFPIMSERRSVVKDEPVGYFNALARSREKANLRMIRYYTALHTDLRRDYRHFYIVHTDPSSAPAKQWLRECATITDIMTPEKCIRELSRDGHDGKEQCFDFYERYLVPPKDDVVPEKQAKQITRIQDEDIRDSQSSLESGEIRSSS